MSACIDICPLLMQQSRITIDICVQVVISKQNVPHPCSSVRWPTTRQGPG
ncbi:hypothetical protein CGRA01v4_02351 [Colletotrichum graminicola]|nr:hypothetical protein CGRA01v4_02351 [Colletotrichum graminicola]